MKIKKFKFQFEITSEVYNAETVKELFGESVVYDPSFPEDRYASEYLSELLDLLIYKSVSDKIKLLIANEVKKPEDLCKSSLNIYENINKRKVVLREIRKSLTGINK